MLRATRCAVLGRGGNIPAGFQFETALQMHAWQDLAGIGAPVRVFLLSDLLHKDFPIADIRLAVFLNAFMLTEELRRTVKTKVQKTAERLRGSLLLACLMPMRVLMVLALRTHRWRASWW